MAKKQNIPTKQAPRDAESYLKQLEELLKRNTGTGTFIGQDTSSNIPMYIPGRVVNPTGLGETPSTMMYGNGMQAPAPVDRPEPMQYQEDYGDQLPENPTGNQMLQALFTKAWEPQLPSSEQLDEIYQQTGQKYPIASMADGGVLYNDGSVEYNDPQQPPLPIASMADGSVLWSDGLLRERPPEGLGQYLAGVAGLSQFLFGEDQTVTQEYGAYNPEFGYAGGTHGGVDFRTRDLQQREMYAPVQMRVVQVLEDDGTQFGTISGHQGYGNSVLLELPSGEMIRLSHLSSLGDFQVGQVLNAGDLIGMPGNTGNSNGEHLDVEYYNVDGQRDNPNNFVQNVSSYSMGNQIVGVSPYIQPFSPQSQAPTQTQTQAPQQFNTPTTDAITSVVEAPQRVLEAVQPMSQERQQLGEGVNQAGLELAQKGIGTQFGNSPEGFVGAGEVVAGDLPAAGRELSATIERVNPTPRIDTGLSELLRGDVQGAKTNFMDTASRIGNRASQVPGQIASEIVKPAYADDGTQKSRPESIAQNLAGAAQSAGEYAKEKTQDVKNVFSQAGEGVKALGQAGIDSLQEVFTPKIDEAKRAVGDVKGIAEEPGQAGQFSSVMDTAQSLAGLSKNDVRDSFFKMGGSEMYKDYLKPDAERLYGGALTLDIFNNDFFKDLGNISSVFGGSKDLGAATDKYIGFEKEKYKPMSRMNYEEGYDRGAIDNYNKQVDEYNQSLNNYFNSIRSSVNGSQSIFTPPPMSSSKNIFASSKPQMSMAAQPQMSMAAPQMSAARPSAPQMSSRKPSTPQMSFAKPQMSSAPNMSVNKPQMSVAPKAAPKPQMSVAPRMSVAPKPTPKPAPKPQMSVAPRMSYAPQPQSKPKSNIFSSISSTIRSIFRR